MSLEICPLRQAYREEIEILSSLGAPSSQHYARITSWGDGQMRARGAIRPQNRASACLDRFLDPVVVVRLDPTLFPTVTAVSWPCALGLSAFGEKNVTVSPGNFLEI